MPSPAHDKRIPPSLHDWFADCAFAVTAFSGGVDSSLVAWLANATLGPERNMAVISASPSLKLSELDTAKQFCRNHGIPLKVVATQELQNPDYFLNPANRCFFCKKTLYTELEQVAAGIAGSWILNGTNTDDVGDYRPGLMAASDFSVRSPLLDCGMDKEAVRALAATLELECWDKPASPCLSSRIPYGQRVTEHKLRQIEDGEAVLIAKGFPIVRLRHKGDTASIEVPPDRLDDIRSIEDTLAEALRDIGFEHMTIDPEGFVSGKLNRVLE